MKIKQIFGFVMLIGVTYGLWIKMSAGMDSFRIADSLLIFFVAFIIMSVLGYGIYRVLRS